MYREEKSAQYIKAPYVLKDEKGTFTIGYERKNWIDGMKYFKTYIDEEDTERRDFISKEEFNELRDEAEAVWGKEDPWTGNFVPGLLNPELKEVNPDIATDTLPALTAENQNA